MSVVIVAQDFQRTDGSVCKCHILIQTFRTISVTYWLMNDFEFNSMVTDKPEHKVKFHFTEGKR